MSITTLDEPVGVTAPSSPAPTPPTRGQHRLFWLAAILIIVLGAIARIYPSNAYKDGGFDESLYRDYALMIERFGLSRRPFPASPDPAAYYPATGHERSFLVARWSVLSA